MTTGCLTITIGRVGGGISATMSRIKQPVSVSAERQGGITANMGLVCGPGLGLGTVLWASDAKLMTIDGGFLLVMDN